MVIATVLSVALILISVLIHYAAFRLMRSVLPAQEKQIRARILMAFSGLICAYIILILMFAVSYAYLHSMQQFGGGLVGKLEGEFVDFFYFSLMSFTTLGVGDIYATGPMRIIVGIQVLNGFALMGWSALFAYFVIKKTD